MKTNYNFTEVRDIKRVYPGKNVFDCLVMLEGKNFFIPVTVDLDNPGDLKKLANYIKANLS